MLCFNAPPINHERGRPDLESVRVQRDFDQLLGIVRKCGDGAVQLNHSTFLLDQDACYPQLVELMAMCGSFGAALLICEVSEFPVLLSSGFQTALEFLQKKDHPVRMLSNQK